MYPDWYFNDAVKFSLIRFTQNRQFFLGVPKYFKDGQKLSKWYKCNNVQSLNYVFEEENIKQNKFNCFVSLAKYKDVPKRYYGNGEWKHGNLTIPNWNSQEDNWKYVEEFDFFIDIDAPSHEEMDFAYYSAREICNFFDRVPVKYTVRFSGKGFHILIPDGCFSFEKSYDPSNEKSIYKVYSKLAKFLYERFSELIDLKIYVSRCKIKLPCSISLYEDNKEYVCVPLTTEEFDNFKLEKMKPELWINSLKIITFDEYRNKEAISAKRLLNKCEVLVDGSEISTV